MIYWELLNPPRHPGKESHPYIFFCLNHPLQENYHYVFVGAFTPVYIFAIIMAVSNIFTSEVLPLHNWKSLQKLLLHWYYTPDRLAAIFLDQSPLCGMPRSLPHKWWHCPANRNVLDQNLQHCLNHYWYLGMGERFRPSMSSGGHLPVRLFAEHPNL